MGKPLCVLLIATADEDMRLILNELQRGGYEPTLERVDTAAAMGAALEKQAWDVVLSDFSLPYFSAPAALALMRERGLDIPFIVVSGAPGSEVAAAAMNAGAHDYVPHTYIVRLIPALERELRAASNRAALRNLEQALREAETKYQTLVEQIPAGLHLAALDADSRTISISPQIERILGFAQAEWLADPQLWRKQLHPEDHDRVLEELSHLYAPGAQPFISEYRMLAKDGRLVWLRDETVLVRDETGQPRHLQSFKLDITARKRAEAEVQEIQEKLAGWVKELEQHNREITLLNELSTQLQSCLTAEEAYPVVADFVQLLFPAETGALYMLSPSRNSVERVAAWGETPPEEPEFAPDECWGLRRGRMYLMEDPRTGQVCAHVSQTIQSSYLCMPMMAQGEALGVLHLRRTPPRPEQPDLPRESLTESKQRLAITVAEHVALALANLKLRETLRIQSSRDPLTGLFNRRYLEEALERELRRAARKERPLSVILIDLDDINTFNQAFGHEAGDAVLRELGDFLQTHVREEDLACRYSGEEFTLMLPETTLEIARQRAEKLREAFTTAAHEYRGQALKDISLSIGLAAFPENGATVEMLLRAADADLVRLKTEARENAPSEPAPEPAPNGASRPAAALPTAAESQPQDTGPLRLQVGDLSLNFKTFELTIVDKIIMPTPVEFELLQFLMSHAGQVFTAAQLLQEVWHYPPGTGSPESVRAHIKNLRGKIEPDPRHPVYLRTLGRFGYTIPVEDSTGT
jgi:diguanylate cyclase (GGDEF)-like protein/PAS domain S-box-containing protein